MARRDEISAGLLAFRRRKEPEFLLAHPGGPYWAKRDDSAWTIPKGLVRPDDLLTGARREFNEETGFIAKGPFIPLAPVKQKSGKTVHGFAFEGDFDPGKFSSNSFELEWPPHSGRRKRFPEIDRLGWFDYDAALQKLIAYQRPFLEELGRRLADGSFDADLTLARKPRPEAPRAAAVARK
jgi:predicted NUDIX family NTP pyrophosphohydrolase